MSARAGGGLREADARRLAGAWNAARSLTSGSILRKVLKGSEAAETERLSALCYVEHTALLVFPDREDEVGATLGAHGLAAGPSLPSVIVRARLAERYGIDPDDLLVRFTHARQPGADRTLPGVEVFMLAPGGAVPDKLVEQERAHEWERHLALRCHDHDSFQELHGLIRGAGFEDDGGGFNPHEDPEHGGVTVRYLVCRDSPLGTWTRLEVKTSGRS